jgi:hypothetical protein
MSAIKATAYTFPIILALTIPSFAAYHGGGHIGGFRGGGAFHAGGLNHGFRGARGRFFRGGQWWICGPYEYETGICPFEY